MMNMVGFIILLLIIIPRYNDSLRADSDISNRNVAISNVNHKSGYNEPCLNDAHCTEVDNVECNKDEHVCLCKDGFKWTGKKCKNKKDKSSWMWILWVFLSIVAVSLLSALYILIGLYCAYGRGHISRGSTWSRMDTRKWLRDLWARTRRYFGELARKPIFTNNADAPVSTIFVIQEYGESNV